MDCHRTLRGKNQSRAGQSRGGEEKRSASTTPLPLMPMASSSFNSFTSPLFPPRLSSFTPISEHAEEEEEGPDTVITTPPRKEEPPASNPLHTAAASPATTTTASATTSKKATMASSGGGFDRAVDCCKCRPSGREKISVVPVDTNGRLSSFVSTGSGSRVKSLLSSLTCKADPGGLSSHKSSNNGHEMERELTVAELSRKLVDAVKKRDEALADVSRLRQSMAEMDKKFADLESHCHDLREALHRTSKRTAYSSAGVDPSFPVNSFLQAVTESRTMLRHLSRSLATQIRQTGSSKTMDRLVLLLRHFDILLPATTPGRRDVTLARTHVACLEALLSRVFYEDFEAPGVACSGSDRILDPFAQCAANRRAYEVLKGLNWEEVLVKGTKHHSEELSRFCDQKMSDVAGMLGWGQQQVCRSEPLLRAFFAAAKSVWLVHLLTRVVHPAVPVFRVEKGDRFEPGYMEEVEAHRVENGQGKGPVRRVRMMVAPGFYVYSSVIKCKVICMSEGSAVGTNV